MRHKILIGFMGSGKSAVSVKLAEMLGWKRLDTDARIEQEQGMTVSEIFRRFGEPAFRGMETRLLQRLAEEKEPLVISAGGGLAVQPQNREYLRKLGDVIWLQVRPETVLERLAEDTTRPLLQGADRKRRVESLLAAREPLYRAAADYSVDTDGSSPRQIAEEILRITEGGHI